jgi:replicative DNA helicase
MSEILLDLDILKAFMNRETFDTLYASVNIKLLCDESKIILDGYKKYYKEYDADKEVDIPKFQRLFFDKLHRNYLPDKQEDFRRILTTILSTDESAVMNLKKRLLEEKLWNELTTLKETSCDIKAMRCLIDSYDEELKRVEEDKQEFCSTNFDDIFTEARTDGLNWRLRGLQNSLGPLVRGDFGIIAAYVETGKTAFCSSEGSYMAQQMKDDQKLQYFVNEGLESKILMRMWCSTLQRTEEQIRSNRAAAIEWYTKKMNGDINRVQVFPALCHYSFIGSKASQYNPALIIIDQLDNISGFKNEVEVIRNRHLYQWARDLAAKHCPVMAVTQCDASVSWFDFKTQEEKHQRFITMRQLNYSKIDKQSAADFMITIGKDPTCPGVRFIHTPKNKLPGLGGERYTKFECNFNERTMLYED